MLKNYLKIALRNLVKNKTYSLINIVGLALGMSVSMLILMFVMHEFSYDKFHENHNRIYRILASSKMGDKSSLGIGFHAEFGPKLKAFNPHVQDYVRVNKPFGKVVLKNPSRPAESFFEEKFMFADPSFFSVFSFNKLSSGSAKLDKPFTMVISERMAKKYFGSQDPVGNSLVFESKYPMQIVGVVENPPSNSSLDFDFVASLATYPELNDQHRNDWKVSSMFNTYLLLDSNKSVPSVTKNLKRESDRTGAFTRYVEYLLEGITTIHLGNNFSDSGNTKLINIFIGVAVLILSLALFNYMSLATAQATKRAKEVGVRKVVGAGRSGLVKQFYVESILMCLIAFILALVFVRFLQQPFYSLLDLHIDETFLFSSSFAGWVIALLVITALLAGSYPAFILSGFAPLQVLKGYVSDNHGSVGVRRILIVLQFAVSIALIIGSLVVKSQLSFMQNKSLGFYKDQVLSVPLSESVGAGYFAMRNEIRDLAGVKAVSVANSGIFKPYNMWFFKNADTQKDVGLTVMNVDRNFAETLGLKYKVKSDPGAYHNQESFLLNEVAVKELGLKGNPIGQKVMDGSNVKVAGVVRDFNFQSLQNQISALGLYVVNDTTNLFRRQGSQGILYTRLDPKSNIQEKVALIGRIFKKYDKEKPFEYYFLNDAFNETFKTEIRMSKMFSIFTAFAIFIASIGLFGLVTFTSETRTKEIGIRKVLGASIAGIVVLLSKDFIKLIFLSILLAIPAAYYFMDKWLQDFPYRIQIPVWIYFTAILMAIGIALLTISFQSIKAALMNPVKSLKSE